MGTILSSDRSDEFFFDRRTQEWRWLWDGQWWTFDPFQDDFDGMLRTEGLWVSDRGSCWYGVDPDRWVSQYERRMEQQRRWIHRQQRNRAEVVRCKLVRQALQKKMPGALVELALHQAFGWAAV